MFYASFVDWLNYFELLLQVATIDINHVHTRLKVTIPREPDLATARRAQIHRYSHFFLDCDCEYIHLEV